MSSHVTFNPDDIPVWFWDTIKRADKDRAKLEAILQDLPQQQIHSFALEFRRAADYLQQPEYVDHYRAGKGKSEDGIADMTYWVVSQGKEFYLRVCDHAES